MELYAIWRDFDRLPEFIPDLEYVTTLPNEIVLDYEPPAGRLASIIPAGARFLGRVPDARIRDGLRQFKARLEAGDIPTTEGQTSGR
jgi:uncharacterized membrane protein